MDRATEIRDELIRHKVRLSQYATGRVIELLKVFREYDRDIRAAILEAGDLSGLTGIEIEGLLRDIEAFNREAEFELQRRLEEEFDTLVKEEIIFALSLLAAWGTAKTVPESRILEMAAQRPIDGMMPEEVLGSIFALRNKTIAQAVRRASVNGDTVKDVVRSLYGDMAGGTVGSLASLTNRSTDVVVRMLMGSYENVAHEEVFKENEHIIRGVQWVAVLDDRTCVVCGELDGKVWALHEAHPEPPQHANCRCILTPVIVGEEPARPVTFASWLSKQTSAVQKEILGPSRYELYRNGARLESFVIDGRIKTLSELGVKKQ